MNYYEILNKYDIYAFDYISYPHKSFWKPATHDDYVAALRTFYRERQRSVLYLHLPFCAQMCFFCLCSFKITHDYERIGAYLNSLFEEVIMQNRLMENSGGARSQFREVHLGGGSPTYMREAHFANLKHILKLMVDFKDLDEFTIEIDPRAVGRDRLAFYADQGIDRISFGIQDFDRDVQVAINRIQPPELIENILSSPARKKFKSVNFDLLVGLPKQNTAKMGATINRVIAMKPDRIALSYMHFNPKVHPHQHVMVKDGPLPSFSVRKEMHELAASRLQAAGYLRSGFEHFALPSDDVGKAVEEKKVGYSSLGATPGRATNMVALGVSSYSQITDWHYFQQTYDHAEYARAIGSDQFPIARGCHLEPADKIRREIIQTLRSQFELDIEAINLKYHCDISLAMMREFMLLREMQDDGMIELKCDRIKITDLGRNFTNVICRVFDTYVRGEKYPSDFFDAPRVRL